MKCGWVLCLLCLIHAVGVAPAASAHALQVYRCGDEYTNQPDPKRQCTLLPNAAVTVIEGTQIQSPRLGATPQAAAAAAAASSSSQVDGAQQRARDAQARLVLQAELQRAQARYQELLQEWNQGELQRRSDEHRQPANPPERMAQWRAALERSQADIAGLQRELSRQPSISPGVTP